jgi:hypothetical protein
VKIILVLLLGCCPPAIGQRLHQYVFFNLERSRIHESAFLHTPAFEGAQLKYTWRELEPSKGEYHFGPIESDLNFLAQHGKRLFIQLQDVSFDAARINVPSYVISGKEYGGGVALQFDTDTSGRQTTGGWVSRRWDPAVRRRLICLIDTLGKIFDGRIEGINLPETSVTFGNDPQRFPDGFTPEGYRDAIISLMKALKKAFPKSVAMIYANFMPGEWLPAVDHSFLRSIFDTARTLGVGLGGPDLLPYRRGQMNNGYRFLRQCSGIIPSGIAVQDGNYDAVNPRTGRRVTIGELMEFADTVLHVQYVFWCTEEPYYSDNLLPYLSGSHR